MSIPSQFVLRSSSPVLQAAAEWAKEQALAYASASDPVGLWYEAALPGREAFCMRDVAHMSTGAAALGLGAYTKNMLFQFARYISESKDWCTYWEITKDGLPCPDDYTNDDDFWYNLPANFDVIDCCWRQYLWSGDPDYLTDERLLNFYEKSLTAYISRWDRDGDGIPEQQPGEGRRGIASYMEDSLGPKIAGDLVAAQYAAYTGYSRIAELRGWTAKASEYRTKAENLQSLYDSSWWDASRQRYYGAMLQNGSFHPDYYNSGSFLPLYYGLIDSEERREHALRDVKGNQVANVEEMSYLPDILYAMGEKEAAYRIILELCDPLTPRREYPEVSYTAIGNLVTGLLGVKPLAEQYLIQVNPQLPEELEWVEAQGIAVFNHLIGLRVDNESVTITNEQGAAVQVSYAGQVAELQPGQQLKFVRNG
ncbi:glycosyl hydrolase family 65 protein [Paenibacillus filicis]|uniref:Glycosyl hydrolase family 65 protein n=1 Tax=Paenibacillus filicis TaxID=669464 RepID=A0ABU9DHA9_9BACL